LSHNVCPQLNIYTCTESTGCSFFVPPSSLAVASCQVGSDDIGKWMVQNGEAVAYRQFSTAYIGDEEDAARSRKGVWNGTFELPKEWRKHSRVGEPNSQLASAPPAAALSSVALSHKADCNIKGNISSTGERIYHMPQGQYYKQTRIDTDAGERWFCSAGEAQAAGWRPSSR